MGYYYTMRGDHDVFVASEHMPALEAAAQEHISRHRGDFQDILGSTSIEKIQIGTGWRFVMDEQGNITNLYHSESKHFDDSIYFLLAPFMRPGSFIEIEGDDDDDIFRIIWRDGRWKHVRAKLVFDESEADYE